MVHCVGQLFYKQLFVTVIANIPLNFVVRCNYYSYSWLVLLSDVTITPIFVLSDNVQGRLRRENRLLEWCGTETPVVVSSKGSGVLVEFISNYQKTERGFRLDYSSVSLIGKLME